MRILSELEFLGDCFMWIFSSLIPCYPIVSTLYLEASAKDVFNLRNYTKINDNGTARTNTDDLWSFSNCGGMLIVSLLQFAAWTLFIYVIELDQIKRIKAFCRRRVFNQQSETPRENDN